MTAVVQGTLLPLLPSAVQMVIQQFCCTCTCSPHVDYSITRALLKSSISILSSHQVPFKKKDEKKCHGAVDESSSEQQFRKLDVITIIL